MKKTKLIYVVTALFFAMSIYMVSYANSAPVFITSGDPGRGVIPRDEVPLTVEKEILTFDIPALMPEEVGYDINESADHSGTVTAQYFFNNPTGESITVRLAFAQGTERANTACDVRINDKPLDTRIRYTYTGENDTFFGPDDVGKIRDNFAEDDFFYPDMPVTGYMFSFSGLPENEYVKAVFNYSIPDGAKTRIMIPCSQSQSGEYSRKVKNGESVYVYVLGEDKVTEMSWNISLSPGEEKTVYPEKTDERTLLEFATFAMRQKPEISEMDCYNVAVDGMNASRHFDLILSYLPEYSYDAIMWIEYEFTIDKGESAVNTVRAVLAPEFYNYRKHPEFTYYYLLSPAQCWKKFGSLDVIINTPHQMYGDSKEGFEKTETGYNRHYDSLPTGELSFCLISGDIDITEGNDKKGHGGAILGVAIVIVVAIFATVMIIGLIIAVIVIIVNRKKRGKK